MRNETQRQSNRIVLCVFVCARGGRGEGGVGDTCDSTLAGEQLPLSAEPPLPSAGELIIRPL